MAKISSVFWKGVGHIGSAQFLYQAVQWLLPLGVGVVIATAAWADGQPLFIVLLAALVAVAIVAAIVRAFLPVFDRFERWRARRRGRLYVEARPIHLPVEFEGPLRISTLHASSKNGLFVGYLTFGGKRVIESNSAKLVVTNYSPGTLVHVALIFDYEMQECLPNGNSGEVLGTGEAEIRLEKVKSGEDSPLTTFIVNECPHFLNLSLKGARGAPVGEKVSDIQVQTETFPGQMYLMPHERWRKNEQERAQ